MQRPLCPGLQAARARLFHTKQQPQQRQHDLLGLVHQTPEASENAPPTRQARGLHAGRAPSLLSQVPLTSASTATAAASVPSVAVPTAPRAVLLLLIDFFGLGHLDLTLQEERTMGQTTATSLGQGHGQRPLLMETQMAHGD